jgi:hypothetical protein
MNKMKKTSILATIVALTMFSAFGLHEAFAHQRVDIESGHDDNKIRVTVGHTNEPAYGASSAHDGRHGFEMSIVDLDTRLPVPTTGSSLKLDKYYFKDIAKYNKATSVDKADQIQKNIALGSLFGTPGVYLHRQIVDTGVYGYRIYGTVNYYGVETIPIDITAFCDSAEMTSATKFESGSWAGSFGCPISIDNTAFPTNKRND